MKVSTIIPVHNGERFLAAAIESVLAQDYQPLEVLVIDDGSTDNSAEIAHSFVKDGVRVVTQTNAGVAAARNTGVQLASGELIAFLDQDDYWLPGKLSRQVRELVERPELAYVLTSMRHVVEPGTVLPRFLTPETVTQETLGVLPGAMLVRKSAFDVTGLFDTQYITGSDLDWFFRANDAGLLRSDLPEVFLERRIHADNNSRNAELMEQERLRIIKHSIARRRKNIAKESSR